MHGSSKWLKKTWWFTTLGPTTLDHGCLGCKKVSLMLWSKRLLSLFNKRRFLCPKTALSSFCSQKVLFCLFKVVLSQFHHPEVTHWNLLQLFNKIRTRTKFGGSYKGQSTRSNTPKLPHRHRHLLLQVRLCIMQPQVLFNNHFLLLLKKIIVSTSQLGVKMPKLKTSEPTKLMGSNQHLTSPYAVSNAVPNLLPRIDPNQVKDESNDESPPSGYILPGKMKLGDSLNVPALNSVMKRKSGSSGNSSESSSFRQNPTTVHSGSSVEQDRSGSVRNFHNGAYRHQEEEFESSEDESESPYRSSSGSEGANSAPKGGGGPSRSRSSRLSLGKGKSVVHKNLEDNYGAVISANHEALAQILEQVGFTPRSKSFLVFLTFFLLRRVRNIPSLVNRRETSRTSL